MTELVDNFHGRGLAFAVPAGDETDASTFDAIMDNIVARRRADARSGNKSPAVLAGKTPESFYRLTFFCFERTVPLGTKRPALNAPD
jgi:hypothetical protein